MTLRLDREQADELAVDLFAVLNGEEPPDYRVSEKL